jgi:hypothetical protein
MLAKLILLTLIGAPPTPAQVNILTANGGNDRTNANLQEVVLSPTTVNAANFGKLVVLPVDGQIYAQPLYVSDLSVPGIGTRNVVFVATMRNSIFAFDADATSPMILLWQISLGLPVPSTMLYGPYSDISGDVGILSTPAIDLQRGVMYVVSENLEDHAPMFYLHAIDLLNGSEQLGGPVAIRGAVPGSGPEASADGTVTFKPMQHIQRPGLLLVNGLVYVAFGSHGDQSPYHGWLMTYDASDLTRQGRIYMTTPSADGGAIWQSGRGPAADEQGSVYVITGNGDYDGVRNFGQSFLKLSDTAPRTTQTSIQRRRREEKPNEEAKSKQLGSFTPADWKSMSDNDFDLSAGPALIRGTKWVVGADKGGKLYLVNGPAMGRVAAQRDGAAQVIQVSSGSIFNFAVWTRPDISYLYVQGSNDAPRCLQVTSAGVDSSPLSVGATLVQYSRLGMTLSADGILNGTGILWEITGNPHDSTTSGTLRAFDASNLTNELWNSDVNPADNMGPIMKFVSPTVANGRVYIPTFDSKVVVYGLRQ